MNTQNKIYKTGSRELMTNIFKNFVYLISNVLYNISCLKRRQNLVKTSANSGTCPKCVPIKSFCRADAQAHGFIYTKLSFIMQSSYAIIQLDKHKFYKAKAQIRWLKRTCWFRHLLPKLQYLSNYIK